MNNYEDSVKLEEVAHWWMTIKMKGLFIASHPVLPWSWCWFLFKISDVIACLYCCQSCE